MNKEKKLILEKFFSVYEENLIKILQDQNLTAEEKQKEVEIFGFTSMFAFSLTNQERKTVYKLFGSLNIDSEVPPKIAKYKDIFQETLDQLVKIKEENIGEKFLKKYKEVTGKQKADRIEGNSLFALILSACLNLLGRRKNKEITKADFIVYFSKILQKSNIIYKNVETLFFLTKNKEKNDTKKQKLNLKHTQTKFLNLEKEFEEIDKTDNIDSPLFTLSAQFSLQILDIFIDTTKLIKVVQPEKVTKEKKNLAGVLHFSDEFLRILNEKDIISPLNAIKLPMVCRPKAYTIDGKGGGYLLDEHNKDLASLSRFMGLQEGLENLLTRALKEFSSTNEKDVIEIVHKLFLPLAIQSQRPFIKKTDYAENEIEKKTLEEHFLKVANKLGAVPYQVDKEQLEFTNKIADSQEIICEDLVTESELILSEKEVKKAREIYENFVETKDNQFTVDFSFKSRLLLNKYLSIAESYRRRKQRRAIEKLYLRYLYIFSFAEKLYFPVTIDPRTRLYLESFFSIQLGKAIRALFNFAKTTKVDIKSFKEETFAEYLLKSTPEFELPVAFKSLLNTGYHAFGLDKVIDEKKRGILYFNYIKPLQNLFKEGETPEKEFFQQLFKKSKDPFLAYKFLRVFSKIESFFNSEKKQGKESFIIEFSLPGMSDARTNALQHSVGLGDRNNEKLLQLTGLAKPWIIEKNFQTEQGPVSLKVPQDIYSYGAELVKKAFKEIIENSNKEIIENLRNATDFSDKSPYAQPNKEVKIENTLSFQQAMIFIRFLLENNFVDRAFIKTILMPKGYGLTLLGASKTLHEFIGSPTVYSHPNFPFFPAMGELSIIAKIIFNTIESEFETFILPVLRIIASLCSKEHKPIIWETPLGMTIKQRKYEELTINIKNKVKYSYEDSTKDFIFKEKTQNIRIKKLNKDKSDSMENQNSFPPNLTHSLEGTQLWMTLANCFEKYPGICIGPIHDCLLFSPEYYDEVEKEYMQAFEKIYAPGKNHIEVIYEANINGKIKINSLNRHKVEKLINLLEKIKKCINVPIKPEQGVFMS